MVKLNRIYTRTGDDGTTGLVDGSRTPKHATRMQAIGDVDELNSAVGIAMVHIGTSELTAADNVNAVLNIIQNDLFDLGADIATPGADFAPSEMTLRIIDKQVEALEQQIDTLNAGLKPLTSFILPGGSPAAAAVHLARAIARRAERSMVAASHDVPVNPLALQYINRLSDYLFVLARYLNAPLGGDPLWVPGGSRNAG